MNAAYLNQTNLSYNLMINEEFITDNFSYFGSIINSITESMQFRIFIGTLWSLLVLFGVIGNGLVIFIALVYKKLNDITNCYIFNLAITDLLFVLFCIPFTTFLYLDGNWVFGITLCKLNHFISHASVQSTCLTLTAMTIHRCNLIIKNKTVTQNASNISRRRKGVIIVTLVIWIISLSLSSPDLIFFTTISSNYTGLILHECSLDLDIEKSKRYINITGTISIITTYVIPLVIIILSYARLLSHLARNQHRLAKFNENSKTKLSPKTEESNLIGSGSLSIKSTRRRKSTTKSTMKNRKKSENRRRKVTKMVAVVTLNFGICWLPTHLFIIIRRFYTVTENSDAYLALSLFKQFAHTLSYLTPVINPCLYAFYNENFRSSLSQLCNKVFCRYSANGTKSLFQRKTQSVPENV